MRWARFLFPLLLAVLFSAWFPRGITAPITGPCDLVTCNESYSLSRRMVASYSGPLFQLYNGSTTLDIGQTVNHVVDMSTWSAFCSGVQSNCKVSKIYAQMHTGSNDIVPSVFLTSQGTPNCSTGGAYVCAAPFTIEVATGYPILTTVEPAEYTLVSDQNATGINAGTSALSIVYNGLGVANHPCCGVFGLTHKYNAADTVGTDFMAYMIYGQGIYGSCSTTTSWCFGAEEETAYDVADYSSSTNINVLGIVSYDGTNTVAASYNNHSLFSQTPPKAVVFGSSMNVGLSIHAGGGGDLSQPARMLMREAIVYNGVYSGADQTKIYNNTVGFYSALSFP